ncbi:MAG: LytTR family DNA-binding domain-containing protein [Porticoccaceae bacterium]|nr:LytTR family DNA-binding domain-containing protein [Porticoccaceae bacterium]
MSKLRVLIVDDEPLALSFLRSTLIKLGNIDVVAEAKNGREAIAAVTRLQPDLMFLDIQMPGMNGFEVVQALQIQKMPMVVFVTAFDQFAADAFDINAVDYILKPLDAERVSRSVERALGRLAGNPSDAKNVGSVASISKRLATDQKQESGRENPDGIKRKLLVRDSGVVKIIPFDDIDWVDAAGDYMCVHANGETHIIRITLGELMEKLDASLFVRIHRSTIVNIERVVSITALPKGGSLLELSEGTTLKVSRNYRESVRNFFQ